MKQLKKAKKQKGRFLGMLWDVLGAILLGYLLASKSEQAKEQLEQIKIFNATPYL